jgi:RHS repeat-associated protein
MTDGAGTQSYAYDAVNRLKTVTRSADTFSYNYDLAGNVTRRTCPDGTITDYTYDADARLATVANGGQTTSYAYDVAGNLATTTLPAGNGHVEERSYDRAGRLTRVKNVKGANTLVDVTSTLDPVGNPTQVVRAGSAAGTTTYAYDARDRLTEVCFQASCVGPGDPFIRWTYDAVGNRLTEARPSGTTNYTYNASDQLIQAGSTTYAYDENGNETGAGARTFVYDLANRLASTTSGGATTAYSYDGDGRRIQATSGSLVTKFLWDPNHALAQLALERDGAGALVRRYIYGARRISMTSGGSAFYYHHDSLNSVANLTSSTGTNQWTYEYEPFGATRSETQADPSAPVNPLRFSGEYMDATGLYHLRARQYDPSVGRFLSRDPLDTPVSEPHVAAYAYAADRPTVLVDPSGERMASSDGGQYFADEASDACSDPRMPDQRIRCAHKFLTGRFVGAKASNRKIKFPKKYSAGLVGNFWTETEADPLNPRTVEEGGRPGRGIAQWDVRDRWQDLRTWASRKGLSEWKFNTQLRFVWYELHTTELRAWGTLIATRTVEDAAIKVMTDYERAEDTPESRRKRVTFALRVFQDY